MYKVYIDRNTVRGKPPKARVLNPPSKIVYMTKLWANLLTVVKQTNTSTK